MDRNAGEWLRWSRAAILAFVALFTGAVAHASADGLLPSLTGLAFLYGFTVVVAAVLLGRPATMARIVTLTVAGQAAIHVALTATAGHTGDAGATHPAAAQTPLISAPNLDESGRRVGSLWDQYDAVEPVAASGGVNPIAHLVTDLSVHAPMMAVHVVAAALVGIWLAVGERALWTVLALTAGVVLAAVVTAVGSLRPRVVPAVLRVAVPWRDPAPPHLRAVARSVVRRGPPLLLAA
ncbi:hypothetical protein [Nocardioides speluncae]|uniref:hypothetical protein n=1 Tax=Nocardioides speluncae TaxID=2670337 RepID=UPI000D68CD90|nr:hypothetical protein [Nocardioides speluncae]